MSCISSLFVLCFKLSNYLINLILIVRLGLFIKNGNFHFEIGIIFMIIIKSTQVPNLVILFTTKDMSYAAPRKLINLKIFFY